MKKEEYEFFERNLDFEMIFKLCSSTETKTKYDKSFFKNFILSILKNLKYEYNSEFIESVISEFSVCIRRTEYDTLLIVPDETQIEEIYTISDYFIPTPLYSLKCSTKEIRKEKLKII